MAIKLFNKGARTIDGAFKPQSIMSFTPEAAAKLQRLYGEELVVMNDDGADAVEATEDTGGISAEETKAPTKVKVSKAK